MPRKKKSDQVLPPVDTNAAMTDMVTGNDVMVSSSETVTTPKPKKPRKPRKKKEPVIEAPEILGRQPNEDDDDIFAASRVHVPVHFGDDFHMELLDLKEPATIDTFGKKTYDDLVAASKNMIKTLHQTSSTIFDLSDELSDYVLPITSFEFDTLKTPSKYNWDITKAFGIFNPNPKKLFRDWMDEGYTTVDSALTEAKTLLKSASQFVNTSVDYDSLVSRYAHFDKLADSLNWVSKLKNADQQFRMATRRDVFSDIANSFSSLTQTRFKTRFSNTYGLYIQLLEDLVTILNGYIDDLSRIRSALDDKYPEQMLVFVEGATTKRVALMKALADINKARDGLRTLFIDMLRALTLWETTRPTFK